MSNQLSLPGFGDPEPPRPHYENMKDLHHAAMICTACRLHVGRTQVTWSSGDIHSPLMVVGMGPSVTDDQTGLPYSGPAGDELDAVLDAAGITRDMIYLTNAHKCVARQKDDIYNIRAPIKAELSACRQWLDAEFELVKPKILLCIGSPTAKWLLGDDFNLSEQRGEWVNGIFGTRAMATYQPTYITRLRPHDPAKADAAYAELVEDFTNAAIAAGLREA